MSSTLVIMAAGMGSRYGGLKQIDPVGPSGEIVLDYSVYDALEVGFSKVVFVIRKDIEDQFKQAIGDKYAGRIDVEYVFQELTNLPSGYSLPSDRSKPWGTAHAVLCCQETVENNFAVINADDFYGRASFKILLEYLSRYNTNEMQTCLVGFLLRNTLSEHGSVARGICQVGQDRYLTDIVERLKVEKTENGARDSVDGGYVDLTGNEVCSMNMWGFTPSMFSGFERYFREFLDEKINVPKSEFLIPDVIATLMDREDLLVDVPESSEHWLGVTYSDDKPKVQAGIKQMIDDGKYPASLWG